MDNYGGTKHTGIPVKTLKKLLKKAGLKVSGKKATLTRRAKRAKLFGGGLKMGQMLAKHGVDKPLLTSEQQKAKDANDAYLASQARDRGINAQQAQAIDAETKSRVTTTYKPSKTELERQVGNLFGQPYGGKKKTRRS